MRSVVPFRSLKYLLEPDPPHSVRDNFEVSVVAPPAPRLLQPVSGEPAFQAQFSPTCAVKEGVKEPLTAVFVIYPLYPIFVNDRPSVEPVRRLLVVAAQVGS